MRNPRWVAGFGIFNRWYLRRHFDALRVLRGAEAPPLKGPVVVYSNHPGWWDPLVLLWLAAHCYPQRNAYGPMDAAALARYRFFMKLGVFGVRQDSRGGADFLRTARTIMADDTAMLWLTAQGQFADPRTRPLLLKPGLAHLPACLKQPITYLPLALEYPFGTERQADIRVAFGPAVRGRPEQERTRLLGQLAGALTQTQARLAEATIARQPALFTTLWRGSRASHHGDGV